MLQVANRWPARDGGGQLLGGVENVNISRQGIIFKLFLHCLPSQTMTNNMGAIIIIRIGKRKTGTGIGTGNEAGAVAGQEEDTKGGRAVLAKDQEK